MQTSLMRTARSTAFGAFLSFAMALALPGVGIGTAQAGEKTAATAAPSPPETDPDILEATRLLNDWEGDSSVLEKARSLLAAALERNPKSARAYRRLALLEQLDAMETAARYDPAGLARAQKALDRALELEPTKGDAFVLRADIDRLQKRFGDAEAALARAEALGSAPQLVAQSRAALLQAEGRYAEALPVCEATKVAPDDPIDSCLMASYEALGRLDDVEALHKSILARNPESAWSHGNFATFLLCNRDRAEAAALEARTALQLMNYGIARRALAAALYRQWSTAQRKGDRAAADRAWSAAQQALPGDPVRAVAETCNDVWTVPMLEALRDARRGSVTPPVLAVLAAAEKAPYGYGGIFALEVQGGATIGGSVYLNSEPDYRDPRCLSIEFTPEAAALYRKQHGSDPEHDLKGKTLLVAGFARRVRIDFMNAMRLPSGAFYYQTHVLVEDPGQVSVVDPAAESERVQDTDEGSSIHV